MGIKCPKNGHACINFACQNGSAINCQWQQAITNDRTDVIRERQSGFYWVKVAEYAPWSIGEWHQDQDSGYWTVPASMSTLPNRFFLKIDERRIVRESVTTERIRKRNENMIEPYKRYMVFIWDQYYPGSGLSQVHASFDDLNEAIEYAAKTEYEYSTVFDRIEGIEIG